MTAERSFANWFYALAGEWELQRNVSDGSRFAGIARFDRASDRELLLCETGALTLPDGQVIQASRSWVWRNPEPETLHILYAEAPPRAYHEISLSHKGEGWEGNARHLCGQDFYDGTYLLQEGGFTIRHHVTGPAKDYRMVSRYSARDVGLPDHLPRTP